MLQCDYVRQGKSVCASGDIGTSNQIVLTGTLQLLKRFLLSGNSRKSKYRNLGTYTNTEGTIRVILFGSKSNAPLHNPA